MKKVDLLSRAEMKKVMGGDDIAVDSLAPDAGDITKIEACKSSSLNDPCVWIYQGSSHGGRCLQFGVSPLACSSLL